jgi:hypothetical protein
MESLGISNLVGVKLGGINGFRYIHVKRNNDVEFCRKIAAEEMNSAILKIVSNLHT